MEDGDERTVKALNEPEVVDPVVSDASIEQVSEEASKGSDSSEPSSPIKSSVFQKWNNPVGIPPKINFFKFIAATRAWQRLAKEHRARENAKSVVIYENTYRMEPKKGQYFAVTRVEMLLRETLEKRLKLMRYSADGCRITARELCADIKRKVKEMNFPRYKFISEVFITENKRQGIQIASRSLLNTSTDNFASCTYRNKTLIAVANVYGIYYE